MLRSFISFVVHRRLLALCATLLVALYGVYSYLHSAIEAYPDVTNVQVDPKTGTLIREGVQAILNPFCEYALDQALRSAPSSSTPMPETTTVICSFPAGCSGPPACAQISR